MPGAKARRWCCNVGGAQRQRYDVLIASDELQVESLHEIALALKDLEAHAHLARDLEQLGLLHLTELQPALCVLSPASFHVLARVP